MAEPVFATRSFKGLTLKRTFEKNDHDKLAILTNLTTTEDGFLQIRGGVEKLKASGGGWVAGSELSNTLTSKVTGAISLRTQHPVIMRAINETNFTEDLSQIAWQPIFATPGLDEEFWVISERRFTTFQVYVGLANVGCTVTWYYRSAANGTQPLPSITEQFTSTGLKTISFAPPSIAGGFTYNWGVNNVGGYVGFAILARITTAGATAPRMARQRVIGDFSERRSTFVGWSDAQTSATSGTVERWTFDGSNNVDWKQMDTGFLCGVDNPTQFSTNDGILYYCNGTSTRRTNSQNAGPIGYTKPTSTGLTTNYAAGAGTLTGIYQYAISYGYGPGGLWGESAPTFSPTVPVGVVNLQITINLPAAELATLNSGIVDTINLYRSVDLTGANVNAFQSQPHFLHQIITRSDTTGLFPGTYTDNILARPFPPKQMDVRERTPPTGIRFFGFHKNRGIAIGSSEFGARLWRSFPNEWEAFDLDSYQDFSREQGGQITAVEFDFNDMVVLWTEDAMFGVSNIDQEDWNAFVISNAVGCIAPESVVSAYGFLFWLSRDGIWMWDGREPPEIISKAIRVKECSRLVHGGSRATHYNYGYEIEFLPEDKGLYDYQSLWPSSVYCPISDGTTTTGKFWFNIKTKEWTRIAFNNTELNYMQPIAQIVWPVGTSYSGRPAPLYARCRESAAAGGQTPLRVWVGEAEVQDDGNAMTCSFQQYFGPNSNELIIPDKWSVDVDGFATPTFSRQIAGGVHGYTSTILGVPLSDLGATYDTYQAAFTAPGVGGTGDLYLTCSMTLNATISKQGYVYGSFLYGKLTGKVIKGA